MVAGRSSLRLRLLSQKQLMDIETLVRYNSIEYKYQCDILRVCFVVASKYCTLSLSCGRECNLLMIVAFMSSWADQKCEHRLNNLRECLYSISAQTVHDNQSGSVIVGDCRSAFYRVRLVKPNCLHEHLQMSLASCAEWRIVLPYPLFALAIDFPTMCLRLRQITGLSHWRIREPFERNEYGISKWHSFRRNRILSSRRRDATSYSLRTKSGIL